MWQYVVAQNSIHSLGFPSTFTRSLIHMRDKIYRVFAGVRIVRLQIPSFALGKLPWCIKLMLWNWPSCIFVSVSLFAAAFWGTCHWAPPFAWGLPSCEWNRKWGSTYPVVVQLQAPSWRHGAMMVQVQLVQYVLYPCMCPDINPLSSCISCFGTSALLRDAFPLSFCVPFLASLLQF